MLAQLPETDEIRTVFLEVLSGADFEPIRTSLAERVVRSFWTVLRRLFGDWFPALDEGPLEVLSFILVTVVAISMVVVAWRKTVVGGARGRRPDVGVQAPGPRGVTEWVEWARGARSHGDLRLAATGLYQAVILHLEGRGALHYREWKTPGDYALEVAARDEAAPFESFLALFVQVAFGPQEPTDDAVASLFQRAEGLGCPI